MGMKLLALRRLWGAVVHSAWSRSSRACRASSRRCSRACEGLVYY